MDEDFLLGTEFARTLFHGYAEKQPIIDYHCHIDPREIAEDKSYSSIADIWLAGDHYKWRARGQGGEEPPCWSFARTAFAHRQSPRLQQSCNKLSSRQ